MLVVSFALLGALWTRPLLQDPPRLRLVRTPRAFELVAGAAGVLIFGVAVYAGLAGTPEVTQNLAPTFVYVLFWVGVPVLCVLLGDVFRPFNPWRAVARAVPGLAAARRPYPRRLGRWPAVAALLAFAWLELVFVHRSDPETLAWLALGYAAVQLAGMAVFGVDAWTERADGFSVYFALVARLAPLERRDGALWLRPPAVGATGLDLVPGTVAVVCTVIGTTTFDGASNGSAWRSVEPHLQSFLGSLEAAATVGLLACVAIVALFYRLGVAGMRTVSDRFAARDLAGRFAHTLVPIAFAYVLAHYFSLLAIQGQAIGYLVSDPLGTGANIFGTAHFQIDLNVFSSTAIWYVQVGALVVGHVTGLVLAHDRALAAFPRPREAARSQYWMLVVMVGFTCLGLWLLSAVST